MANTSIATLVNANVYLDGASLAGVAEEVTLPDLKPKLLDHKPVSGIGGMQLFAGLDQMSMKIKWNSVNNDVMKAAADFMNSHDIMVRSNQSAYKNGSIISNKAVVAYIRGTSKQLPALDFKHQENVGADSEFSVTMYKLEVAGEVLFHVDVMAQIYIVDGVDMLAEYRSNLGI